jgi:hypothetical protein
VAFEVHASEYVAGSLTEVQHDDVAAAWVAAAYRDVGEIVPTAVTRILEVVQQQLDVCLPVQLAR